MVWFIGGVEYLIGLGYSDWISIHPPIHEWKKNHLHSSLLNTRPIRTFALHYIIVYLHICCIYIYVVYLELSMFMTTFLVEASPSYCIPAQLSVWESWETCSTTCGVGQRNRERTAGLPFWWGGRAERWLNPGA